MIRKTVIVLAFIAGAVSTEAKAQELAFDKSNIATQDSLSQNEEINATNDSKKSRFGLYVGGAFSLLTGYGNKDAVPEWEEYDSQMRKGKSFYLAFVGKPVRKLEVGGLVKFGMRSVQCTVESQYDESSTYCEENISTLYAGFCAIYKNNFGCNVGHFTAKASLGALYYVNDWVRDERSWRAESYSIDAIFSIGYLFNLTRNGRIACGPYIMNHYGLPFSIMSGDFCFYPTQNPSFDFGLAFNFNF